jgi:hypothetical protein
MKTLIVTLPNAGDTSPPSITYISIPIKTNYMKKVILFVIAASFIYSNANSQITKGNWMLGGSASFSSIKTIDITGGNSTSILNISGNVGYFITNKLAIGLKPNVSFESIKTDNGHLSQNVSAIGPFLRYYFFPFDGRVNFFTEVSYALGVVKSYGNGVSNYDWSNQTNSFSFKGGPAIFLNSSVALELSLGYLSYRVIGETKSGSNTFQIGLGLQFHLEKN